MHRIRRVFFMILVNINVTFFSGNVTISFQCALTDWTFWIFFNQLWKESDLFFTFPLNSSCKYFAWYNQHATFNADFIIIISIIINMNFSTLSRMTILYHDVLLILFINCSTFTKVLSIILYPLVSNV